MKFSQFNSIIPFEGKFALYNSFNQKVILLLPELKDILNTAVNEGIDVLNDYHPSFYTYLIEEGFIVEQSLNEVEELKKISKEIDENPHVFFLTINPTMNCNFKCWYCYETHIPKSKLNDLTIDRINKLITSKANSSDLKKFSLSFFGGEPLLFFKRNVTPIINHFVNSCASKGIVYEISFTSNGYLINQEFIDFFLQNKIPCSLQITLDGYKEEHDLVRYVNSKTGSFEQIIKNIKLLITNNFFVRVRINYTDKNIANTSKIANEFSDIPKSIRDEYLLFDFHRVWQNEQQDDTSSVMELNMKAIKDYGFQVTNKFSPNNVIDSCYADKRNSVVINYNGDIYKCTARDFTPENREGFITESGELFWENNSLEKRMNAKFKNKSCLKCRIMPLCNGGCSQHALENADKDYCVYFGDESEKDRIVNTKVIEIFDSKKKLSIPALVEV